MVFSHCVEVDVVCNCILDFNPCLGPLLTKTHINRLVVWMFVWVVFFVHFVCFFGGEPK